MPYKGEGWGMFTLTAGAMATRKLQRFEMDPAGW